MSAGPLQMEEIALLGIVNSYVGIRSEVAKEAVAMMHSPNFTYLTALYHLDSLRVRNFVMVSPISRTYTLTPAGVSALYEGVERMNKLTQTFTNLKERR